MKPLININENTKGLSLNCQTDPDLWFSDSPKERSMATSLCDGCFFKEECKILGEKEEWGVWGGVDRTHSEVPKIKTCRSGKHPKEGPGTCLECRKESQATYYKKNAVAINKKKPPRVRPKKHVEGGYCVNGHLLSDDNIIIRSNDQALLCKKCTTNNKRSSKAYNKVGDYA